MSFSVVDWNIVARGQRDILQQADAFSAPAFLCLDNLTRLIHTDQY
jgi:hypothetical protein